jgi:hypothetical protein
MKSCPICESKLHSSIVMNARSRFADFYICSECGQKESFNGFFWKLQEKAVLKRAMLSQHEPSKS